MVSPIPKWVWKRYALLWKKFGNKTFTFEQAKKELEFVDGNVVSVMFNELKNAGWIKVSLDVKDTRKRIYNLVNPLQVVENIKHDIKKN